jgi:hypothetical protein
MSSDILERQHARAQAIAPRPSVWNETFGFDADKMLQDRLEHLRNRVSIWQAASDEEWEKGREGMIIKSTWLIVL